MKKIRFNPVLVILLVIVFAAFLFFVSNFYKKPEIIYVDVSVERNEYSVDLKPPEYWQVDNIKIGETVYSSFGLKQALVVDLERRPWSLGRQEAIDMVLQYEAPFNSRERVYTIDGKALRIGEPISINFGSRKFKGVIKNVYKNTEDRFLGYEKKKIKMKLFLKDYYPWHLEKLRNFIEYDSKGNMLIEVVKLTAEPANVYIAGTTNSIYLGKSSDLQNAIVELEIGNVICKTGGGQCLFNYYHPLAVGFGFYGDNGITSFGTNSSVMEFIAY